jgi:hypothetical protein
MASRKAAIANFEKLDPKVCAQIKKITEETAIVEATAKLDGLKTELAGIEKLLSRFYQGPYQGEAIPSAEKDGAAIIAGTSVATLPGLSRDTELQNLIRQRDALLSAIQIQTFEIQQLTGRLITSGCRELEPIARKYIAATVEAFEAVKKALREQEVFFMFISQKGYASNLRPHHWQTWPYEQQVLYGGICSLDFYLEQRRKVWKLET